MVKRDQDLGRHAQIKQDVAGFFARVAPLYDRVGPRFFSHFGRRLVEIAEIPTGARVLDVATGKGAVLFPAAEAVGPRGGVTGVDLSEAMVRELADETHRLALTNVEVRQMDAEDLQLPDSSFDHVLCGFAIFFIPRPLRALSEMRRVLKPNGHVALSTWDRSFGEQWRWYDELAATHLPPDPAAPRTPDPEPFPPPAFGRQEDLERILREAGFTDIRVIFETAEFVYPDEEQWLAALWSHGTRATLEKIEKVAGPDGLERFKSDLLKHAGSAKRPDGIHEMFPTLFTLGRKAAE